MTDNNLNSEEFRAILINRMRFNARVNTVTLADMPKIMSNVEELKAALEEQARIEEQQAMEKQAIIAKLQSQIEESGLDITLEDLVNAKAQKSNNTPTVKYALGEGVDRVTWSGMGRMPKAIKEFAQKGGELSELAV